MALKLTNSVLKIFFIGLLIFSTMSEMAVAETASAETEKSIELDQERIDDVNKLIGKLEGLAAEARQQFSILIKTKGEERSLAGVQVLEIEAQIRRLLDGNDSPPIETSSAANAI